MTTSQPFHLSDSSRNSRNNSNYGSTPSNITPTAVASSSSIATSTTSTAAARINNATNQQQQQQQQQSSQIRHSGKAHIRGKIRRVWRPRYLELLDNGYIQYYELPITTTNTSSSSSSIHIINPTSSLSSCLPSPPAYNYNNHNNRSNKTSQKTTTTTTRTIPKCILAVTGGSRMIDVTTLRDMHVGLPRGCYGFVFRGQKQLQQQQRIENNNNIQQQQEQQQQQSSPLVLLDPVMSSSFLSTTTNNTTTTTVTSDPVYHHLPGAVVSTTTTTTTTNPEPRDFLCAVATLEEAQMWVVALQWASDVYHSSMTHNNNNNNNNNTATPSASLSSSWWSSSSPPSYSSSSPLLSQRRIAAPLTTTATSTNLSFENQSKLNITTTHQEQEQQHRGTRQNQEEEFVVGQMMSSSTTTTSSAFRESNASTRNNNNNNNNRAFITRSSSASTHVTSNKSPPFLSSSSSSFLSPSPQQQQQQQSPPPPIIMNNGKVVVSKVVKYRTVRVGRPIQNTVSTNSNNAATNTRISGSGNYSFFNRQQFEIAYEIHGMLLHRDFDHYSATTTTGTSNDPNTNNMIISEQWSMLRTADDFQELIGNLCKELGPSLLDRAQLGPMKQLPRFRNHPTCQELYNSVSIVDSILRSLVMDVAMVNAHAMKSFLGLSSCSISNNKNKNSYDNNNTSSSSWWSASCWGRFQTIHDPESVLTRHQEIILLPPKSSSLSSSKNNTKTSSEHGYHNNENDNTNNVQMITIDKYVKQWLIQKNGLALEQKSGDFITMLLQRPLWVTAGGMGITSMVVLPIANWLGYHCYRSCVVNIPTTITIRIDLLVVSWLGAAYLGSSSSSSRSSHHHNSSYYSKTFYDYYNKLHRYIFGNNTMNNTNNKDDNKVGGSSDNNNNNDNHNNTRSFEGSTFHYHQQPSNNKTKNKKYKSSSTSSSAAVQGMVLQDKKRKKLTNNKSQKVGSNNNNSNNNNNQTNNIILPGSSSSSFESLSSSHESAMMIIQNNKDDFMEDDEEDGVVVPATLSSSNVMGGEGVVVSIGGSNDDNIIDDDIIDNDDDNMSSEDDEEEEDDDDDEGEEAEIETGISASALHSLFLLSSPLPKFNLEKNIVTTCWSEPVVSGCHGTSTGSVDEKNNNNNNSNNNNSAVTFHVRGATYLQDRIKIPSGPPALWCRGVDIWMTDNPERHIARHPAMLGGKLQEEDTFLVNFLLPFGNFVAYFGIPPLSEFPNDRLRSVWTKFLNGDQQYRDARLKLLPVVVEGPWIVKTAVGPGKSPALLGKVIPLQYFFRHPDSSNNNDRNNNKSKRNNKKGIYEVDVIITASTIAKGILSIVKGNTKSVTIAFAFIIEASEQEELPETVLCSFQIHSVHLEDCPVLPYINLDEIEF